jgi:flagella basal body P-ring formation protein FlgA
MRSRVLLLLALLLAGSVGLRAVPAAAADPGAAYTGDRFRAEISRLLAAHFNLDGDLQVEFVRPWTPPERMAAVWQVVLTEFPATPSNVMLLRCRIVADGLPVGDESVLVRASLWRDAWFARQPVAAGSIFNPAVLDIQRIDSFRVHDAVPVTSGDRTMSFTRDIPADRVVTWHDLTRRPLVRKGELVEATAREGELYVTMKAMALENGARGDVITLRNLESHNEISAQVVDENRVEISF